MEYTLIRTQRTTAAIYVRPDGTVEVRAPQHMPKAAIDSFLQEKTGWIRQKVALALAAHEKQDAFSLHYGSTVRLLGGLRIIEARPGKSLGYSDSAFFLPPNLTPEQIKAACIQLYRHIASQILTYKTAELSKLMEVSPRSVKISNASTRWGSCSGQRCINFSWRLIMAEEATVNYVIIHELAHLLEMNHSPKFWSIVTNYCPDYPLHRNKLKELQRLLHTENWEV